MRELDGQLLEAGGGDDLQQWSWLVGGVSEGVPHVARLIDEVAGCGVHHVRSLLEPPPPSSTNENSSSHLWRWTGAASPPRDDRVLDER
jgi:hypothetical protein